MRTWQYLVCVAALTASAAVGGCEQQRGNDLARDLPRQEPSERQSSNEVISSPAAQADAPEPSEATTDGRYRKSVGGDGELSLTRMPGRISRVYAIAGGIPNGMATAADCAVIADGFIDDAGVFDGRIVFAGGGDLDEMNPDEGSAVESDSKLTIVFSDNTAEITAFDESVCGMGSGLAGMYRQ
jgi:hypothetical protein